jgi:hypothetical protein
MRSFSSRSGRALLQRELGELGEVLPYMFRGAGACPAAGWYATIDGETVFLGGHLALACLAIARLQEERAHA